MTKDEKILADVNRAKGWLAAHPVLAQVIFSAALLLVGFILGKIL